MKIKQWLENQEDEVCLIKVIYQPEWEEEKYNWEKILYHNKRMFTYINGKKIVIAKGPTAIRAIYDIFNNIEHSAKKLSQQYKVIWFNEDLVTYIKNDTITVSIDINRTIYTAPNHQGRVFDLLKKYDMKNYYYNNQSYQIPNDIQNIKDEYYGTPFNPEYYRGLTNKNENFDGEYEDYIWAGMDLDEIETNPERYNGRWSQEIWNKHSVWRIM